MKLGHSCRNVISYVINQVMSLDGSWSSFSFASVRSFGPLQQALLIPLQQVIPTYQAMLLAAQTRASRDIVGRTLRRRRIHHGPTSSSSTWGSVLSSSSSLVDPERNDRTDNNKPVPRESLTFYQTPLQSRTCRQSMLTTTRSLSMMSSPSHLQTYTRNGRSHTMMFQGQYNSNNQPLFVQYQLAHYSSSSSGGGDPFSKRPPRTLETTRVPTPPSAPQQPQSALESLRNTTPKSILRKGADIITSVLTSVLGFLVKLPSNIWYFIRHPDDLRQRMAVMKKLVQDEIHHYWVGFKVCVLA